MTKAVATTQIGSSVPRERGDRKTHVASLLRKLGLRDRVQVVVWAYESGVIRPGV